MTQIHQILFPSKSQDFYNDFLHVAKNIEGFWLFFYFCI
jgi:hypothetical protein